MLYAISKISICMLIFYYLFSYVLLEIVYILSDLPCLSQSLNLTNPTEYYYPTESSLYPSLSPLLKPIVELDQLLAVSSTS